MTSLTQQAQHHLMPCIKEGDTVIDATCGNGHDTLFLAQQVGANGHVLAFDIQQQALENTRQRLAEHQCLAQAQLIKDSHANLQQHLPSSAHGKVSCVMFNLGYLPGADKSCITQTHSTLQALRQALKVVCPQAMVSIMLYPGHQGGDDEASAVMHWLDTLSADWQLQKIETPGPIWLGLTHKDLFAAQQ